MRHARRLIAMLFATIVALVAFANPASAQQSVRIIAEDDYQKLVDAARRGVKPSDMTAPPLIMPIPENTEWYCGWVDKFTAKDAAMPGGTGPATRTHIKWGNGDQRPAILLLGNFRVPQQNKWVYAFLVEKNRDTQGNYILARTVDQNILPGAYCPAAEKK